MYYSSAILMHVINIQKTSVPFSNKPLFSSGAYKSAVKISASFGLRLDLLSSLGLDSPLTLIGGNWTLLRAFLTFFQQPSVACLHCRGVIPVIQELFMPLCVSSTQCNIGQGKSNGWMQNPRNGEMNSAYLEELHPVAERHGDRNG